MLSHPRHYFLLWRQLPPNKASKICFLSSDFFSCSGRAITQSSNKTESMLMKRSIALKIKIWTFRFQWLLACFDSTGRTIFRTSSTRERIKFSQMKSLCHSSKAPRMPWKWLLSMHLESCRKSGPEISLKCSKGNYFQNFFNFSYKQHFLRAIRFGPNFQ